MTNGRDIRDSIQKGEILESPPAPSHLSEADVAFETDMIGREINGRFKVLKVLGHGGFGSVFLAHQKSVDRQVAIKILRPSWSHRPQVAQRFLIEAKATSQLQNQHTVTVFDFGTTEDELLYIAMEYLEGQTLQTRMTNGTPLSTKQAVNIVSQIAESLAEAHDREIVHRDLKPENVLLLNRENNEIFVKVLDFGIARSKELSDQLNLTQTGQFSGTPAYMSPEVIRSKAIGPGADVYSLGILLYQMLTGKCPFEGDNPFDVLTQHVSVKPKPMRQIDSTLPVRIDIFVQKCLSKKAGKRPSDARTFLKELQNIERTELLSGTANQSGKIRKASSSAATIAVVEETQDALHFSRNLLRWVRIWINANPAPVTALTVIFGLSVGTAMLFLDSFHSPRNIHQPVAAAATYFPAIKSSEKPQEVLKSSPFLDESDAIEFGEKAQRAPADLGEPEGTPQKASEEENLIILEVLDLQDDEEPWIDDELDGADILERELFKEDKQERNPAPAERVKNTRKKSSKNRLRGQATKEPPSKVTPDRTSILLGDAPNTNRKTPALDKVDAFLD